MNRSATRFELSRHVEIARTCLRQVGNHVCDQLGCMVTSSRAGQLESVREFDLKDPSTPQTRRRNTVWNIWHSFDSPWPVTRLLRQSELCAVHSCRPTALPSRESSHRVIAGFKSGLLGGLRHAQRRPKAFHVSSVKTAPMRYDGVFGRVAPSGESM